MKYRCLTLGIILLLLGMAAPIASNAASAKVAVKLVQGSQEGNDVDSEIRQYSRVLKGLIKSPSLKVVGRSSATIPLPGSQRINLGNGHTLNVDAKEAGPDKFYLRVVWSKGRQKQQEAIFRNVNKGQPYFQVAGKNAIVIIAR